MDIVLEFYQAPFTSQNPDNFDDILAQVPQVVTAKMNTELMAKFMTEEVETTLKQMAPLKSPGPDGMPPIFYQHYCSLMQFYYSSIWVISLHLCVIHL